MRCKFIWFEVSKSFWVVGVLVWAKSCTISCLTDDGYGGRVGGDALAEVSEFVYESSAGTFLFGKFI